MWTDYHRIVVMGEIKMDNKQIFRVDFEMIVTRFVWGSIYDIHIFFIKLYFQT